MDLRTRVVVVELARYRVALRFEQRGDGVAECCLAAVADVQRASGVGGDELDHYLLWVRGAGTAVCGAFREHPTYDGVLRARGEADVDEAGAGDLELGHLRVGRHRRRDLLGELPGIALQSPGELQGEIAGEVAVRRVARALDDDFGVGGLGRDLGERCAEQRREVGFDVHAKGREL